MKHPASPFRILSLLFIAFLITAASVQAQSFVLTFAFHFFIASVSSVAAENAAYAAFSLFDHIV